MLLLIDYSSMLYRAYHGGPATLPLHAVHGFLGTLTRVLQTRKATRLGIAIDEDWRPEFRTSVLPMYKAQRVSDVPDPVTPQEQYGRELLRGLGLPVIGAPGFEAEDVIATLIAATDEPVEILSGDRDLFALVRDPQVKVLYPSKGGLEEVTESWVTQKYDIPGRSYGDFALLRGDPSDGLPGVAGIGEKTAARLIRNYGSLENLLKAVATEDASIAPRVRSQLNASADYLAAARQVVLPVETITLEAYSLDLPRSAPPEEFMKVAEEHQLGNAIRRLLTVLNLSDASGAERIRP